MTTPDIGALLTGLVFTTMGVAFVLEAAGAWTLHLLDLRLLGPVALIVIGAAVLVNAVARHPGQT